MITPISPFGRYNVTKTNNAPKKNNHTSGKFTVKKDFAKLTITPPKIAPINVPLPPNATHTTTSIDFNGANSPGFIIPTWGTYKAPAIPANIADTTNAHNL